MRSLAQLALVLPLFLLLFFGGTPRPDTVPAEADREALLRQLHLDLTGLPPTADELADFLKDSRPDAYDRQVERLLAAPTYGERWARHWLDVARFEGKDVPPSEVFRYRDWVIKAFNDNIPFDEFQREQLAGKRPLK
jgi:hypothetical protein